ncbi:hypothetical protein CANCADRAFT_1481 [Tortispora caseinolytica NRRL Y-17796]|uniref:AB hydrolase-1 domain-containing protein n=1 Tax=Tortispora caseinolytica NRRL Y-17796 TaxID=767744 RepID=A0A1E4TMC9_9ASCO|nr:hypothetical protein CANCADRAFT_1481 [Tortispora caseinolytica NRRL Y-17796]
MSFPCVDKIETKTHRLRSDGPEPQYNSTTEGINLAKSIHPLALDYGASLQEYELAYETWGTLNQDRSNAILLHTGLSASSHAHSHPGNTTPGWWESFIGPGKALDTDKYFVICTNVLGGCFGSTGPKSIAADKQPYATRFPILTIEDMVRAQFETVLPRLGVEKLHASIGSSMGGMQSLCAGAMYPEKVGRVVSISGCVRSHPSSIAMRFAQRQVLMADPLWKRGWYYDSVPPHSGLKLAREIATITYRSGPEWEQRFGHKRADPSKPPALCADYLIETYLDHQGEKWCLEYDANSFLYISKAMDLFDMRLSAQKAKSAIRESVQSTPNALPSKPYQEQGQESEIREETSADIAADIAQGIQTLAHTPTLVIGAASDILFPARQQREIADALHAIGNDRVRYVELSEDVSQYGHDTFLLAVEHVGKPVKEFLED